MNTQRFRSRTLLVSLAFTLLVLGYVVTPQKAPIVAQVNASIRYVSPDGLCNSLTPCYTDPQAAIDAAGDGDEIKIATGTYTSINTYGGLRQIVYLNKDLVLHGGYSSTFTEPSDPDLNPTTLDATGQGRGLYFMSGVSATIEGLRITNGDATGLGGGWASWHDAGGGVYANGATVVLSNNKIYNNAAAYGGGMFVQYGNANLTNSTVSSNTATIYAGGMLLSDNNSMVLGSTITANIAHTIGGIMLIGGSATFTNISISNNQASSGFGGGIYISASDPVTITGSNVTGNISTSDGGGIKIQGANVVLFDNNITSNSSGGDGGGIAIWMGSMALNANRIVANSAGWKGGGIKSEESLAILNNNVILDNQVNGIGSGIYIKTSDVQFIHNTIARNTGGDGSGLFIDYLNDTGAGTPPPTPWFAGESTVALTNTIIVSQTTGITITAYTTITVNSVLWYGNGSNIGGGGAANLTYEYFGDPVFTTDGYHLTNVSAALDLGFTTNVTNDIDGDLRPSGVGSDLGADEFSGPPLATATPTPTPTVTSSLTPTSTPTQVPIPFSRTLYLPLIRK